MTKSTPDAPAPLTAREALDRLGRECGSDAKDADSRQSAALKILKGKAANQVRPWPAWKLYFSAAVDRLQTSLHRRQVVRRNAETELRRRAAAKLVAASTETVVARRETSVRVLTVFQALPPRAREVLLRRDCLRQSVAETARALYGDDRLAARNAATQAHRRASAAFLLRLSEEFGEPAAEVLPRIDREMLREAMLASAARHGMSTSLTDVEPGSDL